jgi:hypothetical protein
MEARGTPRAAAAEAMMVPCMAAVKAPGEEPEKTRDRRSTGLPGEGVTRGVLEGDAGGVCVGVAEDDGEAVSVVVEVGEAVREMEGVGVAVSVVVDVREAEGVVVGEGEPVRVEVVEADGGHCDRDVKSVL